MKRKNILKIFFLILIIIVLSFVIYKFYFNNDVKVEKINNTHKEEESKYSSNIIENVKQDYFLMPTNYTRTYKHLICHM